MSSGRKRKQREEEEEKTPHHTEHETHMKEYYETRKREREEYEQQRQAAEEKLEIAEKNLKEAEEKRNAAEKKRDKYLELYFAEKELERRKWFERALEDAEAEYKAAQKAVESAMETQQNAVNRLTGTFLDRLSLTRPTGLTLHPSPSSSRSGSSAGKRQKIEGVLKSQCSKDDLLDFTLKTDEGQQTWEVPAALLELLKDVDPNFLPSGGKVFIRESMKQMLECLEAHPRMQYIEGSPGVGKSLLLFLFAVHRFVKEDEPCLYLRQTSGEADMFYMVMESETLSVFQVLPKPRAILEVRDRVRQNGGRYYVDGVNPKHPKLGDFGRGSDFWVTSAMHSPKSESYSEVLYLSAWTEVEIKNGFKALGHTSEQAELHYSVIGGSFRDIGEDEEFLRSRMREACKDGEIVKTDRLFHTFVTHPRYSRGYERREASEFVVDVLRAVNVQSLVKVYRKIDSASVQGGIFQVITEKWAKMMCANAPAHVIVKCIDWDTRGEFDVSLAFHHVEFPIGRSASRKDEIKGREGVMYCPTLCNFPGCDKLLFCNNELLLINDTVGNHKCKWSTFDAAFVCMRQNSAVQGCPTKVIYLVPTQYHRDTIVLTSFDAKTFATNNVQVCVGYCDSINMFIKQQE